jgi:hypothetical protein
VNRGLTLSVLTAVLVTVAALLGDRGHSSAAVAPTSTGEHDRPSEARASAPRSRVVIVRNPFRLDGLLAPRLEVGLDSAASADADTPPPAFRLRLKGLVGGPPWRAVLSGLPGVTGDRTVRAGERFEFLRILDIDAAGVSVAADDSTWTLTLEHEESR